MDNSIIATDIHPLSWLHIACTVHETGRPQFDVASLVVSVLVRFETGRGPRLIPWRSLFKTELEHVEPMRLFCTSTALNSRVPLAHGGGKKRTAPPSSLVMWIMLIGSCWESLAAAEWCQDSKAARNAWLHHHAVWDQLVAGCEAATAMFHLDDLPSAKTLFRVLWRWMTGCEKMGNWWSVEREGGESEWRRTCPYCTAVQESAAMPRPKSYTVLVA